MTGATRRLLWPGLMTAAMLFVLLGLGTWQVHRLFWKLDILARIDQAEAAPPVPLSGTPAPFTKISVTGEFISGETSLYGVDVRDMPAGPTMGARLIEPLRANNGTVILVDRGWVPLSRTRPIEAPSGEVTVTGYARYGDRPGWFSVRDDIVERHFYTLDPLAIGAALGLADVRPFVLVVLAANPRDTGQIPAPAPRLPRPPNNHLSYAITWYGLAAALLAIFVVWARRESRA